MHDLRDVASALYFVKINLVVSFTIMFVVLACATLPLYTKDMPSRFILLPKLDGMLLGQFLSLLQMFCSGLSKSPAQLDSYVQVPTS